MARTPKGSLLAVATAFGPSQPTTIVTNASEAVVTCTAHGYVNGDIVEVVSGWSRLQKRALRVKSVAANTFVLDGFDSTNTSIFPVGAGIGSVRKVATWVQLSTVMSPSSSGGEAKKVTYEFLESDIEFNINNGFTAVDREIKLDADSIGTPGYTALRNLTDVQTDTILRTLAKSGAVSFLPCTVALNEEEVEEQGIAAVRCTFSGNNRSTRYAS